MNKIKYCIANWKMYLNHDQINDYLNKFNNYDNVSNVKVVFCPPFTSLEILSKYNFNESTAIGSQNVSKYIKGGYTGEISIETLDKIGCKYSIIGHSERRELFNENDKDISEKFKIVYNSNLIPILCIGESLKQREKLEVERTLSNQIKTVLDNIDDFNKDFIIAYEPIWAIGTGVSATNKVISETHKIIKNILKKYRLNNCNIFLLYGGSVNEINAQSISELENVDGFLIGSASTNPAVFYKICKKL